MILFPSGGRYPKGALRRARRVTTRLRRSLLRERSLYLTIDDVPSDSFSQLLEVLDRYNAKATFFVIGSWVNQTNLPFLIQAVKSGHPLGNHTYSHLPFSSLAAEDIEQEIRSGGEVVDRVYREAGLDPHSQPRYFRFPHFDPGYRPGQPENARGHKDNVKAAYRVLKSLEYRVVWSDISFGDYLISSGGRTLASVVQSFLRARGGDIILIHDTLYTPELLEQVLPRLTARGPLLAMPNGVRR